MWETASSSSLSNMYKNVLYQRGDLFLKYFELLISEEVNLSPEVLMLTHILAAYSSSLGQKPT